MNVAQALQNFIDTVGQIEDLGDPVFNTAVAKVQEALGQPDGGPAGQFFDDHWVEEWNKAGGDADKVDMLTQYAIAEVFHLPFGNQK